MNNVNGAAMLARIKPGDLVTIRAIGGGQLTGRAESLVPSEADKWAGLTRAPWMIRTGPHTRAGVTADNIVSVRPDTRTQTSAESDAVPTTRETFGN